MYKFYLDKVLLPVTPSKVETSIQNKNKTLVLINEGEINVLKKAGLTEIKFEALLPLVNKYPFAKYSNGFKSAHYYLDKLESLKTSCEPFQFIISRTFGKSVLFDTNMKVSLEDYTITENAKEGDCITVTINLLQYREYSTKTVKVTLDSYKPKVTSTSKTRSTTKTVTAGCNVIVNGQLHRDSYGNGPGQWRTNYKGKINYINLKGTHPYHVTTPSGGWQGWVLASAVQVV